MALIEILSVTLRPLFEGHDCETGTDPLTDGYLVILGQGAPKVSPDQ